MEVVIHGNTKVIQQVKKLSEKLKQDFWDGMADELKINIQKAVRPHNQTERLYRNIYTKTIPNGVEGGILDNGMLVNSKHGRVNYGAFVHYGTKRHKITPKRKKALRWVGKGGGFAFSKGHWVSGIKKDPFLETAAKETVKEAHKILKQRLN